MVSPKLQTPPPTKRVSHAACATRPASRKGTPAAVSRHRPCAPARAVDATVSLVPRWMASWAWAEEEVTMATERRTRSSNINNIKGRSTKNKQQDNNDKKKKEEPALYRSLKRGEFLGRTCETRLNHRSQHNNLVAQKLMKSVQNDTPNVFYFLQASFLHVPSRSLLHTHEIWSNEAVLQLSQEPVF